VKYPAASVEEDLRLIKKEAKEKDKRKMSAKFVVSIALALVCVSVCADAKLLRHSRYFDEGYDYPAAGHSTGERAILTVRGTRNPYDGSAPNKLAIQDEPHRGPFPRGVYDRTDGYGMSRYPMGRPGFGAGLYPSASMRYDPYGYNQGSYNGG